MKYNNKVEGRIGQINKSKYGSMMEIIEYNNAHDTVVKFLEHGNLVRAQWGKFLSGDIRNVYDKTIFGKGYIGEGEFTMLMNGKTTTQYISWTNMIKRCYDENFHKKYPSYKDANIADEWLNFQNFARWYNDNYYEIDNQTMNLDKDILVKGNKIYSPETCVFVPQNINKLFIKRNSKRGDLPIGVTWHTHRKRYVVQCGNGKGKHIGCYDTVDEAFQSYKFQKEKFIKQIANEYKDKIPKNLYIAMINYQVEITD